MKSIKMFLITVFLGILLMNFSCNKSTDDNTVTSTVVQGPLNPSFETGGNWVLLPDVWNADIIRMNGTGFMPTQGVWYMNLNSPCGPSTSSVYQDDISFSKSKTMTFDYSYVLKGTVTINVFFTSNGTVTLWNRSFVNSPSVSKDQKDEVVTLPSLPDAGRLTIQIISASANTAATIGAFNFSIDNIRVQ